MDVQPTPAAPSANPREQRRPVHKKIVRWMWIGLVVLFVAGLITFVSLAFSDLPDTAQLENPKQELATELYAANGETLGRYFIENRVNVDYEDLSPHLVEALVATEDERYYRHSGIDFRGLTRAVIKTGLLGDENAGGASTITQQLAKMLFTGSKARNIRERLVQKLKEWIIAIRLEQRYTKEEIIAMYLNKYDFLNDGDGIKAAAENYFGKSQRELNIQEAAMLVGMLKNSSLFNPVRRPDTVAHRRMVVLNQMVKNGYLNRSAYDTLKNTPLGLQFTRKTHADGPAPYLRMIIAERLKNDLLKNTKKPDGSNYDLYRDGLRVYTTIDPDMQRLAEEAMVDHMRDRQETFWRHWRGKDWWTYKDEDTSDRAMEVRTWKLQRMIRATDRFQKMRAATVEGSLAALETAVPKLKTRDVDVDRMLAQEADDGHLTGLLRRKLISDNMAATYRRALNTDEWKQVRSHWRALERRVESEFAKPVGMRVFTYDNAAMEKDTVMSPLDSLKYHHGFLQIGSMGVDPQTGHVKTWIGGINFKWFQYDHVTARRQVGSTFKPFVYATAIEKMGFSPCQPVADLPQTILPGDPGFSVRDEWTPQNSTGSYSGNTFTLKDALRKSINTTSVHLMKQIGSVRPVLDLVELMGIDPDQRINGQPVIPPVPSIALGSCDLTVQEMAEAYTTFGNNGVHVRPVLITKVEDRNGRVLYEANYEENSALTEETNHVMVEMLKYAAAMGDLRSESGGKTGTTNDYVDAWFMGVTPELVVGTWVGGDDQWVRWRTLREGSGSRNAKPYFRRFIKTLEAADLPSYDPTSRFAGLSRPATIELDCSVYAARNGQPLPTGEPGGDEDGGGGFFQGGGFDDPFGEGQFGDEIDINLPPTPVDSTRTIR